MIHDDAGVGRLLSRREALELLGTAGVAVLAGTTLGSGPAATVADACVVRPEQTEGPYFVDEMLDRSDIRSDPAGGEVSPGAPLALSLVVSRVSGERCEPLEGARVDLWQCDALGIYSDVRDPHFNTVGHKFLRGYQTTGTDGVARFVTVYPGWYRGRTVHIHFKIRTEPQAAKVYEFTSQLYFDDVLTDRIHGSEPYSSTGPRTTRNRDDSIFRRGGDRLMVVPVESDDGLEASFAIGLQLP